MLPRASSSRLAWAVAGALALGLWACAPAEPAAPLEVSELAIQPVVWNAKAVAVGQVAAVAELYDDTAVLGDQGAQVFTSGLLLSTDSAVKAWRMATVIPAGDLSGQWLVAVDGDGHVRRLKNRSSFEDVSDRYGLRGADVRAVAALGPGHVGFALASEVAIADGQSVTRYPLALTGLVGGGGRMAGLVDGGVRVTDVTASATRDYPLPGAIAVAFDAAEKLVVATARSVYQESASGDLDKVYTSTDAPIRGLSRAGTGVWVALGDGLALLTGNQLGRGAAGTLSSDGSVGLYGSPSGDVWVLQGGTLRRFGAETEGGQDETQWKRTVLPIFTRLCSLCHLPGGSASIDLSTYRSWTARRALVEQRVIVGKPSPMPPAGAGKLTAEEADALKAWLASGK